MLDAIDSQLLDLLRRNGRMPHATLARAVHLSAPSVAARVARLEREGYITGYAALLAPRRVGAGLAAFVRVATQAGEGEGAEFERFVREAPEILECHDVDGEETYYLKVRTSSPGALRALLVRLRALPGVTRTVTSIALSTIKEELPGAELLPRATQADAEPA